MSLLSRAPVTRPLTPGTCPFVSCTFLLTREPTYGSLWLLSQETAGKRRRQGKAKGTRQGGKRQGNAKKILNSGNEPTDLVQTKDLAFKNAKNELVFECKRTQIKPQKGAKKPPFVWPRAGICASKGASGWASTRGATRGSNSQAPLPHPKALTRNEELRRD
jgi:hypothetical protein